MWFYVLWCYCKKDYWKEIDEFKNDIDISKRIMRGNNKSNKYHQNEIDKNVKCIDELKIALEKLK